MSSSYAKNRQKPLKGNQTISSVGTFDTLTANNIQLANVSIAGVYENGVFQNVVIQNSSIINTTIGVGGPSVGVFTNLTSTQDVNFLGTSLNEYVSWDPNTGEFNISGSLHVQGCSYFDNIEICVNTISATNTNGEINLVANGTGSIYVDGALVNVATTGNFSSKMLTGGFDVDAYSNVSMGSRYSNVSMSSYSEHNIHTLNGDVNIITELGAGTKIITNILLISSGSSTGLYQLQTSLDHNLRIGDTINIQGVNYAPFNGLYSINNIIDNTTITFTSGNINLTTGSTGLINKLPTNNINLSAGLYVNIPKNINLVFGTVASNIVGDTYGNLCISSYNNINFNPLGSYINVPQNVYSSYGTSGSTFLKYDGSIFNIASQTIQQTGALALINTVNTRFYDPILTLANYPLNSNDLLDRGIEFKFFNTKSSSIQALGWFGYKNNLNAFTFLTNVTNNNEIITGAPGDFVIGNLSLNGNISFLASSTLDMNCGTLLNVNTITGCGDTLILSGKNTVNITSGNIKLNASGSINVPNNIPINFGSSGSSIYESFVSRDLTLTGYTNIKLISNGVSNGNSNSQVIIPQNTLLSFDGTTSGTNVIVNDTNGNMLIKTSPITDTYISAANVIIPLSSKIQLGDVTKVIYGLNNSLNMVSGVTTNIQSMNNMNMMSSIGNVNISSPNGDITLYSTLGNVRIPSNINLVFGNSQTVNSINVSNGDMYLTGSGVNNMNMTKFQNINLLATKNINILDNTLINIGSDGLKYIYSDLLDDLYIVNNSTYGSIIINTPSCIITSGNLNIHTTQNTNISSDNIYITSSNIVIGTNTHDITWLNASNLNITDPNITINYSNLDLLADKGIGYNYAANSYGWFGVKTMTNRFTFYSNATNQNNIITGSSYGDVQIGTLYAATGISVSNDINLNCNNLLNARIISSCSGDITITSNNIHLSASTNVQIPYNTLLIFGTAGNTIFGDTNGNLNLNTTNSSGTIVVNGNLQVNGISTNIYSTITNIQDPIVSIGGVIGPVVNDAKDRGIEFKWAQNGITKTGFFGFQNLTNRFVFIPDGTNIYEVYYGSYGDVQFGNGYFNNLDVSLGGMISGISTLYANTTSNLITISSGNLLLDTNTTIPYNNYIYFGNTANALVTNLNGSSGVTMISSGSLVLNIPNSIRIDGTTPVYYGNDNNNSIVTFRDTLGNFNISNTNGSINILSSKSLNVLDTIPINFGSTSDQIFSKNQELFLIGYNGVNVSSGNITLSGNVNITGNVSGVSSNLDLNKYILPLGTSQTDVITSIINNTSGQVQITLSKNNYLTVGDSVVLSNTNSIPIVDGLWTITSLINPTTFTINNTTNLTTAGNSGNFKSDLTIDQGKDVGIQVNYWSTTGIGSNTNITSGSINYKTGFFGYQLATQNWVFYNDATISNNVVTNGILGSVTIDTLNTNNISGFVLQGPVTAGSNAIMGSNFIVSGGTIDNTPIGTNIAQSGRFNILSNTVSASFENVTLQSNLIYSFERYTLSSLVQYRNPSINTIMTFVSVDGVSFNASGTLGNTGISDGQIKTIACSSMGTNCSYSVYIGSGNLIAPNIGNNDINPTTLQFNRAGQSVQMIFDGQLSAWIILGRGCMIF